ncbi:ribosomal protein S5 domain 2-type protein [Xylariaceae sp. FL0804]|nr:ribosomal protein S5 domain 2-type protein [Xylariaceae sp. FL0804]
MATTSSSSTTAPGSLTLPSAVFAKLSPHPFLLANLEPPAGSPAPAARPNGRRPREARPPQVNTSSLAHAHGSAVVRVGDTTVICGVRGETLLAADIPNYRHPDNPTVVSSSDADDDDAANGGGEGGGDGAGAAELRDYDLLVPNIELATGCAPTFLPGVPPTALAQTLSTRVYSLLHGARLLDGRDLRIYSDAAADAAADASPAAAEDDDDDEGYQHQHHQPQQQQREIKAYWVLFIDVLFISFDGNAFDAAWAAVVAALRDTRLPRARWDADREAVLCARREPARPLPTRGLPVACTAAVFTAREKKQQLQLGRRPGGGERGEGGELGEENQGRFWVLVDPDRFEEGLCDETLTMVVDCSEGETRVLGLSKSGGTVAGPAIMQKFGEVAEARWKEFRAALE